LRPASKVLRVAITAHFEQKWLPRPLLLPGNRTVVCYNPNPRGTHGYTRAVKGCKGQSCIRVRSARGRCFRFVGDRLELNTHQTPKDVACRSQENQSGTKSTMGKAKLEQPSGYYDYSETQTARLSSIEKENGSRAESKMGEDQSEKQGAGVALGSGAVELAFHSRGTMPVLVPRVVLDKQARE
jgi:hypothetical protein